MFGYIAPRLDLLEENQHSRYRAFYCGICRETGNLSGRIGRLLLSHDMTFLAILLNSLFEPEETCVYMRCGFHPVYPKEMKTGKIIHYAAAMNLILMDFKCEDQVRDDHSRVGQLERKMIHSAVESLSKEYPLQYSEIQNALISLWKEEQSGKPDPDRLCNLSGKMLGTVFAPEWSDPFWIPILRGLGEGLGRFIYWMDAWDDLELDHRKKHVNPLDCLNASNERDFFVKDSLEVLISEATAYFEALPLEKDLDLLRNVLYSGVWQRYEVKKNRAGKGRKKA